MTHPLLPQPAPTPVTWADLDHAARLAWVATLSDLRSRDIAVAVGLTYPALMAWAWRNQVRLSNLSVRKAPEVPAPQEDPAVWEPIHGAVSLLEHKNSQCRWPVGHNRDMCAGRRSRGSYCAEHAAIAFAPRAGDVAYSTKLMAAGRPVPAGIGVEEAVAIVVPAIARKEAAE